MDEKDKMTKAALRKQKAKEYRKKMYQEAKKRLQESPAYQKRKEEMKQRRRDLYQKQKERLKQQRLEVKQKKKSLKPKLPPILRGDDESLNSPPLSEEAPQEILCKNETEEVTGEPLELEDIRPLLKLVKLKSNKKQPKNLK